MTATAPGPETHAKIDARAGHEFDPDSYRMTVGQHLEELRVRLILGLVVLFAVLFIFIIPPVGTQVVKIFLRPLMISLEHNHLSPQLRAFQVQESFMVFIKLAIISAAAISSPWILYQLWQFVAAGLYPNERKYITKYLPLSVTLLIGGMLFVYFLVLPLMLEFFLAFNFGGGMRFPVDPSQLTPAAQAQPMHFPVLAGDPPKPEPSTLWYNLSERRLKVCLAEGEVRTLQFGSDALVSPTITIADYVDMVLQLLISFGLAFQLPLVVLAAVKIGIVEIDQLKKMRRIIYFAIAVIAAFIVPDVSVGMIALMIPLMLLYELGIYLARLSSKKTQVV